MITTELDGYGFIGTDGYNEILFTEVMKLENIEGWVYIDNLMAREFQKEWIYWRNAFKELKTIE